MKAPGFSRCGVSLFPHLIAGPIQRPSHLLPQVQRAREWNPTSAFDGLILILEGLFHKVVIADNCALIANAAFNGSLGGPNTSTVILGTYAFAWQIYGDFSGYSNIARGSAPLLGFSLHGELSSAISRRKLPGFLAKVAY